MNELYDEYYKCGRFLPDPSIEINEDFLDSEWYKELRAIDALIEGFVNDDPYTNN